MKKIIILVALCLVALIVPTISMVKGIQFDQKCGGFLKQAADANSVELAEKQLNLAIDYIESNALTSGYTSILYNTEDENVGFWYDNLKECQKELAETKGNSTLENTNVLMKLRESLTDDSEHGTTLTIPAGISLYPHNLGFMLLNLISVVVLFISLFFLVIEIRGDD